MQNAKCKMQNAKCKMQNAKCKMQSAKCKVQNAEWRFYIVGNADTLPLHSSLFTIHYSLARFHLVPPISPPQVVPLPKGLGGYAELYIICV